MARKSSEARMKTDIENRLFKLSREVSWCAMLGRAIEMVAGGGAACTTDSRLREAVVGALGEVLASLADTASARLDELADEFWKGKQG